jgi:hypothetical protein
MANAIETKATVVSDFAKNLVDVSDLEKNNLKKDNEQIKIKVISSKEVSKDYLFFGCASNGNGVYSAAISQGYSHREARAIRRDFVRDCRGGFWQFGLSSSSAD